MLPTTFEGNQKQPLILGAKATGSLRLFRAWGEGMCPGLRIRGWLLKG